MFNFSEGNGFKDILQRMLDTIPDNLDKRQGSIIYDALALASAELAQCYIALDVYADQTYLLTAVGENLDNKAYDYGVERNKATYSKRIGVFLDSEGNSMEIPIGSRWSTPVSSGGHNYQVTEQLEIGKYILTCETTGTIGNEYYGDLLPLESINNVGSATLTDIYIGGEDTEDDESLRARVLEKVNTHPYGGNIADYKTYVKSIEGIGDCLVIPVWNGGGTVKLLIVTSSYQIPTEAKVEEVQNLVDPPANSGKGYGKAPIGHEVTVTVPEVFNINVEFNIVLEDNFTVSGVKENIKNAISDYLKTVQRSWFAEEEVIVYISRIMVAILSVNGVVSVNNLTVNNSVVDITINPKDEDNPYPMLNEVIINES